jgi:hypothetical protein
MSKISKLGCSVTASLALLAGVASAEASPDTRPQLEGAWQVVVTLRIDAPDCKTAPIVDDQWNPFPSFNTFHRGGTMSEFGTRSPPSTRTPGHGVWKRTGYRSIDYRTVFYRFGPDDAVSGNMDIRADVKVGQNSRTFKGESRLVVTDLEGNAVSFCATLDGKRISL